MSLFGDWGDDGETETVTKEKEYTEHTAVAEWMDGETRQYVFDSMDDSDGSITLKEYTGYRPVRGNNILEMKFGGFKSRAFVTIPHDNLREFETVKRETKTLEYEAEVDADD